MVMVSHPPLPFMPPSEPYSPYAPYAPIPTRPMTAPAGTSSASGSDTQRDRPMSDR